MTQRVISRESLLPARLPRFANTKRTSRLEEARISAIRTGSEARQHRSSEKQHTRERDYQNRQGLGQKNTQKEQVLWAFHEVSLKTFSFSDGPSFLARLYAGGLLTATLFLSPHPQV